MDLRSPGAEVTNCSESPEMGAENQTQGFCKNSKCSNHWETTPSLKMLLDRGPVSRCDLSGETKSYQTAGWWVVNMETHQKRWEITQCCYSKDEKAELSVEEADAIRRPLLGEVLWPSTKCTCLQRVCPRFLQTQ